MGKQRIENWISSHLTSILEKRIYSPGVLRRVDEIMRECIRDIVYASIDRDWIRKRTEEHLSSVVEGVVSELSLRDKHTMLQKAIDARAKEILRKAEEIGVRAIDPGDLLCAATEAVSLAILKKTRHEEEWHSNEKKRNWKFWKRGN